MTAETAAALARIERALDRIEAADGRSRGGQRYDRLRSRTQAALAQLDSVIARVAREEAR
jgi:hypothetical protein